MKIVVVATDDLKEDLQTKKPLNEIQIEWINELHNIEEATCYIDLLFDGSSDRIEILSKTNAAIIIVNDICGSLVGLPENFTRINGWAGFLKRDIVEASGHNQSSKSNIETIFSCFGKTVEWLPDTPGFIAARVISMIINEAYLTLEEKVSSKKEIDTAMKSGTNYPYGPFEWAEKIGLQKVYTLLETLSQSNGRFQPAPLLKKETFR